MLIDHLLCVKLQLSLLLAHNVVTSLSIGLGGLVIRAAWLLRLVAVASGWLLVGVLMISLMWALVEKMFGEVGLLSDAVHRFDIHSMPLNDWLVVLVIIRFKNATLTAIIVIIIITKSIRIIKIYAKLMLML